MLTSTNENTHLRDISHSSELSVSTMKKKSCCRLFAFGGFKSKACRRVQGAQGLWPQIGAKAPPTYQEQPQPVHVVFFIFSITSPCQPPPSQATPRHRNSPPYYPPSSRIRQSLPPVVAVLCRGRWTCEKCIFAKARGKDGGGIS